MKSQENCSFFVSNAHLLTIILPYIDEKINEGKNVTILSQKDLNEDVKRYLKSVKKFDKEGIRKAFSKNKINYESLTEEGILFVIGDEKFISSVNLDRKNYEKIDCYEIENISNLQRIIEKYEYYLRSDGKMKLIKNSQNEQIPNTIKSQL